MPSDDKSGNARSGVDRFLNKRSCNCRSGNYTSRSCNDMFGDIGLVIL